MVYEAKLVDTPFEQDPNKMGYIKVEFEKRVRWARPVLPFGEFSVPSYEWLQKYANPKGETAIGVYVIKTNDSEGLCWIGFRIYKDRLPKAAIKNYSYRRIQKFTEHWLEYYDDKKDDSRWRVEHKDGTFIEISRGKDDLRVHVFDGVLKNEILMDKDGIKATDTFRNRITLNKKGTEIVDHYDNKIETREDHVHVEDRRKNIIHTDVDGMAVIDKHSNEIITRNFGMQTTDKNRNITRTDTKGTKMVDRFNNVMTTSSKGFESLDKFGNQIITTAQGLQMIDHLSNEIITNGEGVAVNDKFKNVITMTQDGLQMVDKFQNAIRMTTDGLKMVDKFKNTLKTTNKGLTMEDKFNNVINLTKEGAEISAKALRAVGGSARVPEAIVRGHSAFMMYKQLIESLIKNVQSMIEHLTTQASVTASTGILLPLAATYAPTLTKIIQLLIDINNIRKILNQCRSKDVFLS